MAARLKKGTAQSFRPANLARIFINLSWYDVTVNEVDIYMKNNRLLKSTVILIFCDLNFDISDTRGLYSIRKSAYFFIVKAGFKEENKDKYK